MFKKLLHQPTSIFPLVTFRIVFGLAMFISTARFLLLGWVEEQYLKPVFHFTYYGFEWVSVLPPWGMYGLYALMLVTSLGIALGCFYRISAIVYFLAFTYTELIDKTYYLNHYYFVSLVAFCLCWVPAHGTFSVDAVFRPLLRRQTVPAWCVNIFKFQLGCVYFFAGAAKINETWLIQAMPLRIWLPAHDDMPLIGFLLREKLVAYLFSWAGMFYDLSIPFLLLWRKTRLLAYLILLFFHGMTGYLFQIGVFPLVMSLCTLIFFSEKWHVRLLSLWGNSGKLLYALPPSSPQVPKSRFGLLHSPTVATVFVSIYVIVQVVLPWRYLLYPGNLFWTEEGYRFSWRVMLVEKAGSASFRVRDNNTGNEFDVINRQFLNIHQEKQMSFQPDMILQYAHFLGEHYQKLGIKDISVFCDCYVTMNSAPSRPIVSPHVDLFKEKESFLPRSWVVPFVE